jgi:hypothetical protein
MVTFHRISISILQQLQTAVILGIFLVVKVIDVLDISVKRIEETYLRKERDREILVRKVLEGVISARYV